MNGPASRPPTALLLSPHLDDVAFSCGGAASALCRRGWRVVVATVFTASVADPDGFALTCQLDKGLPPGADYMAIRRGEDEAACRALGPGVEPRWLGLAEAPHRGYESPAALFADARDDDPAGDDAARLIGALVGELAPDLVLAPRAVGGHVDHRQVVAAALGLGGLGDRLAWYLDLPYAERFPGAPGDPRPPGGRVEAAIPLGPLDLAAKLDGCARHASQVPFQFGGEAAMRARLAAFAAAEASRFGHRGHAETFLVDAALVGRHGGLFLRPGRGA